MIEEDKLICCELLKTEIKKSLIDYPDSYHKILEFLDNWINQINLTLLKNISIVDMCVNIEQDSNLDDFKYSIILGLNYNTFIRFNFENDIKSISISSFLIDSSFNNSIIHNHIGYIDYDFDNNHQSTIDTNNILHMETKSLEKLIALPNHILEQNLKKTEILDQHLCILPRYLLENSEEFRHLVVYIIVKNENGEILSYRRTTKAGESRLHGESSIGIGGHVNIDDYNDSREIDNYFVFNDICLQGMFRELDEELRITSKYHCYGTEKLTFKFKQYIITSDNEVDKVHFGCVYEVNIKNEVIDSLVLEDKYDNLEWLTKDELLTNIDKYENWSKILINDL